MVKPFLKAKVTFEHLSEDLENVREKVPERCEESEQVRSQGRGNVTEQDPVGWGEGGREQFCLTISLEGKTPFSISGHQS